MDYYHKSTTQTSMIKLRYSTFRYSHLHFY